MKLKFILIIIFIFNLDFIQAKEMCENKEQAFYCLDRSRFIWCSGTNKNVTMTCDRNTVCKCGKTKYNPCIFSFQTLSDCEGIPGDILKNKLK